MSPVMQGMLTIVIGVSVCIGYFYASNLILDKWLFPARGPNIGRNINRANAIRPWLFLFPAFAALSLYLAYPVFETLRLSLLDRDQGNAFVGLANYHQMFAEPKFWEALKNNMLWLLVVPAASTAFGLLIAQLTDRLSWGSIAKSLIFMPMAISFVGAAVIWKLVYGTVYLFWRHRTAGLVDAASLEQLSVNGCIDMDSDRFCHGDTVRGAAWHTGRNGGGRHCRWRKSTADIFPHQGPADHANYRCCVDDDYNYCA